MKIPIVEILLQLRHRVVEGDAEEPASAAPVLRAGAEAGGVVLGLPWLYELGTQMLKLLQKPLQRGSWLPRLPPPLDRWTMSRPMPAFAANIREWWRDRTPEGHRRNLELKVGYGALALGAGALVMWLLMLAQKRRK